MISQKFVVVAILTVSLFMLKPSFGEQPFAIKKRTKGDRIVLKGINSFKDEDVKQALKKQEGFLLATHPEAPISQLVAFLDKKITEGYRHNGFPHVEVEVQHKPSTEKIEVKVEEGEKYTWGKLIISGFKNISEKAFRDELNEWPNRSPYNSLTDEANRRENNKRSPIWDKGHPASFTDQSSETLRENINNIFRRLGYFAARFNLHISRNEDEKSADLHLKMTEEGPQGVIGDVTVKGAKKNTPGKIKEYLGIEKGEPLSARKTLEIKKRLWDSGRFHTVGVSARVPEGKEKHVELHINLRELEKIPPLSNPLSKAAQTLLKFREWIQGIGERKEAFVLSFKVNKDAQGRLTRGTAAISPTQGFICNVSRPGNGESVKRLSFAIDKKKVSFYENNWAMKEKSSDIPFAPMVIVDLSPRANNKLKKWKLVLGARLASRDKEGIKDLHYDANVNVPPAAFVDMAYSENLRTEVEGSELIVEKAGVVAHFDTATGRLREIRMGNEKDATLRGGFRRGKFDALLTDHREQVNAQMSATRSERQSSPLIDCALRLGMFSLAATADQSSAIRLQEVRDAILKLANSGTPTTVKHYLSTLGAPGNAAFVIPEKPTGRNGTDRGILPAEAVLAAYWNVYEPLFPPGSWPWTCGRDLALVILGEPGYINFTVQNLLASDNTGPVAMFLMHRAFQARAPRLAMLFASRTKQRLDLEHFKNDYKLCLEGESVIPVITRSLLKGLATLSRREAGALGKLLPKSEREYLLQAHRALVTEASEKAAIRETLHPILARYWQNRLKSLINNSVEGGGR